MFDGRLYPNNKYGNSNLGGFDYLHKHQPKPFNPEADPRSEKWRHKARVAVAAMEPFPSREARKAAWTTAYETAQKEDIL